MQVIGLLDSTKPFDEAKVRELDLVVEALYSGNPQKVGGILPGC
jgi:hypothetical protein